MITTAAVLWALVVLIGGVVAYARLFEAENLQVQYLSVAVPHLPAELAGLRLAHLSDFHCRRKRGVQRLIRRAVRQTLREQPDLVLITGDLAEGSDYADCLAPVIGDLKASYGAYAVLGNHDWDCAFRDRLYGGPEPPASLERWRQALGHTHVEILENENRQVVIDDRMVIIAGVGDPSCGHDDLPAAIHDTESAQLKILLAHSPDIMDVPGAGWADLILVGHTHGGQCRLPGLGSPWAPVWRLRSRAAGLMRLDETWVHVSRGIAGTTQARILCPPTVTILTVTEGEA